MKRHFVEVTAVKIEGDVERRPTLCEGVHRIQDDIELVDRAQGARIDQAQSAIDHERTIQLLPWFEPCKGWDVADDGHLRRRHAHPCQPVPERIVDRDHR